MKPFSQIIYHQIEDSFELALLDEPTLKQSKQKKPKFRNRVLGICFLKQMLLLLSVTDIIIRKRKYINLFISGTNPMLFIHIHTQRQYIRTTTTSTICARFRHLRVCVYGKVIKLSALLFRNNHNINKEDDP